MAGDGWRAKGKGEPAGLQRSLGNQASILMATGYLDGAMLLVKEQVAICRCLNDPAGLSRSVGNQALILEATGDLDGAMKLHKEQQCNLPARQLPQRPRSFFAQSGFALGLRLAPSNRRFAPRPESRSPRRETRPPSGSPRESSRS